MAARRPGCCVDARDPGNWHHVIVSAYVISEVEFDDAHHAERYRELAGAAIALYGGRYVVRGATPEAVEGDEWPAAQWFVILEFSSMAEARRWYESPEYAEALVHRRTAVRRRLLFVEGALDEG